MAVLMTAEVAGQTQAGYDGMMSALGAQVRQAKGFVAHWALPVEGGWRVMELWESAEDATAFFAEFVRPNLPPGITPKRSLQELHSLVRP